MAFLGKIATILDTEIINRTDTTEALGEHFDIVMG